MNNKGQMDFDPIAFVLGLVGAGISMIVIKKVEIGMIWKILTPVVTFAVSYFYISMTGD